MFGAGTGATRRRWLPLLVMGMLVVGACGDRAGEPGATPAVASTGTGTLTFEKVLGALERPTLVTNAADGSGRLFVLEKRGRVRIVKDGKLLPEPFLDVTNLVESGGNEQGLLGLTFHPGFEQNGRFFIAYTGVDGTDSVAEYHVSSSPDNADAASGSVLLAVKDPYPNHNGGMLAFGPDGYLYVSLGDGGSEGDPQGNGQNNDALLGKILRIGVDGTKPYTIPPDNPFAGSKAARPEIWASGLRNPWRFSFDRKTGDLWIADVGQNRYEEIDFQPAGDKGGENYGWNIMEGKHCYRPPQGCNQAGLVLPVFEYSHDDGCSVTGGYVYRGAQFTALDGAYIFADYCSGKVWTMRNEGNRFPASSPIAGPKALSSFGEDETGELYAVGDTSGTLYRVVLR